MIAKSYCVDFDDFCDATASELKYITQLKNDYPNFKVTLFTIPMRTSDSTIKLAKDLGDWVQLAPHGWRHTRGECLAWTDVEAETKIKLAADRGIDAPVFRAPAWLIDADTYTACAKLGYVVASHSTFRVPSTGTPEYIYNGLNSGLYKGVHGHLTNCGFDYIGDDYEAGKFKFKRPVFRFPQDLAMTRAA
jgi:hypothetical protein